MKNNATNHTYDLLITHANVASFANGANYDSIEDAAIAIRHGKIAAIYTMAEVFANKLYDYSQVYHAQHAWITPGLIDCHTHLVFAGNRINEFTASLKGNSYADIAKAGGGIMATVNETRNASFESLLACAQQRLDCWQQQGVTTIEIKTGYGLTRDSEIKILEVIQALAANNPALTIQKTLLAAHCIPPEFSHNADDYISLICDEILPYAHQHGLVDAVDAYIEHIAFNNRQIERLFQKAQALGLPIKCHAEQLSTLNSVEMACSFQALSCDHLEYISDAGITAMANSGSVAVLLPAAFYYLQETQLPPIEKLHKSNVTIAIASDANPGTAPTIGLLSSLNLACVLWRLPPEQVLLGATVHAAKALGLQNSIGRIAVGMQADLAVWQVQHPDEICYRLGANPLRHVFKNGVISYNSL